MVSVYNKNNRFIMPIGRFAARRAAFISGLLTRPVYVYGNFRGQTPDVI